MSPVEATVLSAASLGVAAAVWGASPDRRLPGADRDSLLRRVRASRVAIGTFASRWTRMVLPVSAVVLLLVVGPLAVVPSVVAVGCGLVLTRRRRAAARSRTSQQQDRDDVRALRALAAELRSGLSPADALRTAAAIDGTGSPPQGLRKRMLAAAVADTIGGDPAQALRGASEPGSVAAGVAAAWAVCRVTGAGLAGPVTRIADSAAAQLLLTREAQAALASAHSSARLLAVLPVAGVGLGVLSGTGSLGVLLATAPGQLCLLVGVALQLAGLAWLDRLARTGG